MTAQRLDPRHSIFLDHWLRDFKGGPAAVAAGFAHSNSRQQACKILARKDVQEEIERRHKRTLARFSITRTAIVAEQAKIAFASMGNYLRFVDGQPVIDLSRCSPDQLAAVKTITTETEVIAGPKPEGASKKRGKAKTAVDDAGAPISIRVVKTKLELHDKLRGLELLGRPFGLSNVNVRVTVDDVRPDLDQLDDDDIEALKELLTKALPAPLIEAVATEIDDEQYQQEEASADE